MVDPISIIGLTITLSHVLKSIYGVCAAFPGIPKQVEELCRQLFALQDVLGRVSVAMQFEPSTDSERVFQRFISPGFQEIITSTVELINDLEGQIAPPAKNKWSQSAKQRITWMFQQSKIEEYSKLIESRIDYFGSVLGSENHALTQQVYYEVMALRQQSTIELRKDLRAWLGATDYYSQHLFYLESHQPGTSSWFTNGPFRDWMTGAARSNKTLWLQGTSGSGKSLLASYTIEYAIAESEAGAPDQLSVLYYHYSSSDVNTKSTNAVLASLLQQMCEKRPHLWDRVRLKSQSPGIKGGESHQRASIVQLKELFTEFTAIFPQLCVFIDAPDESSERDTLFTALIEVMQSHKHMKLCVFSRPEVSTQRLASLGVHRVQIDSKQQSTDFELFICGFLRDNVSLRTLNDSLKTKITRTLLGKADGSFKWVESQLQSLADQDSIKNVEHALRSLPPNMDKHYRDTLSKVATKDRTRVRRLLRWLAVQIRPLTIQELSEAVVIDASSHSTILDVEQERLLQGSIERYIKAAGSLVHYDLDTQTVGLGHHSAREFLTSPKWQGEKDLQDLSVGDEFAATETILRACVWYLMQEPFRTGTRGAFGLPESAWPLFAYCAQAWPIYYQRIGTAFNSGRTDNLRTADSVLRFIRSHGMVNGGNYGYWLQMYAPNYVPRPGEAWSMLPPLHLAAGKGWLALVQLILSDSKKELNTIGGQSLWTPLLRACIYGQEHVVRHLLQSNAQWPLPPGDIATRFAPYLLTTSLPVRQLLNGSTAAPNNQPRPTPSLVSKPAQSSALKPAASLLAKRAQSSVAKQAPSGLTPI